MYRCDIIPENGTLHSNPWESVKSNTIVYSLFLRFVDKSWKNKIFWATFRKISPYVI
jgi:hypothetical protein